MGILRSGVRVFGRDWTMGRTGRVWDVFCVVAGWSLLGSRAGHIRGCHLVVEPASGDDQKRQDPGEVQQRSVLVGALGGYQWLAPSPGLCKVPSGVPPPPSLQPCGDSLTLTRSSPLILCRDRLALFYGKYQQKHCCSLLAQNKRLPWESQPL